MAALGGHREDRRRRPEDEAPYHARPAVANGKQRKHASHRFQWHLHERRLGDRLDGITVTHRDVDRTEVFGALVQDLQAGHRREVRHHRAGGRLGHEDDREQRGIRRASRPRSGHFESSNARTPDRHSPTPGREARRGGGAVVRRFLLPGGDQPQARRHQGRPGERRAEAAEGREVEHDDIHPRGARLAVGGRHEAGLCRQHRQLRSCLCIERTHRLPGCRRPFRPGPSQRLFRAILHTALHQACSSAPTRACRGRGVPGPPPEHRRARC
mmetsp:Transcript_13540/g.36565  ORF Transcript_13540/g.36565 Transcript_13540/m.36565 type:complete len:270 (+) Transcript_13540:1044-1853(+)